MTNLIRQIVTLSQRPEAVRQIEALAAEAWPRFLMHADTPNWRRAVVETFPGFQLLLFLSDELIAVGHTVPLVWTGSHDDLPESLGATISRALDAHDQQQAPTTLSALAAIVARNQQRQGVSAMVLREMRATARANSMSGLIAPVRPTLKSRYPLTPMERYVRWTRPDGSVFDPWIRVHRRLGARILKIVPEAMTVKGTVAEWEDWTGMRFPESGEYVVEGALQPVRIDCESDMGHYCEPNVWMLHPIQP